MGDLHVSAEVAQEIRAGLARQRITAREVARRTGLDASSVSRALRGETSITLDVFVQILGVLDGDSEDVLIHKLVAEVRTQTAKRSHL